MSIIPVGFGQTKNINPGEESLSNPISLTSLEPSGIKVPLVNLLRKLESTPELSK